MKHFIFSKLLVALLMMFCCCTTIMASDVVIVDGFKYLIDSEKCEATLLANDYEGEISIPAKFTYNGVEFYVGSLGAHCFEASSITKVDIPASVHSLGQSCFEHCKISTISIPNSVTEIGSYCFSYCDNLFEVKLPSNLKRISSNCFSSCQNLGKIEIPQSVKFLENSCFISSGIKKIKLSETITEIGDMAFALTPISEIEIPNSVTKIGAQCFSGCEYLKSIKIPSSVIELESSCFNNCKQLEKAIISAALKEMKDYMFDNCSSLREIALPSSLEMIDYGAFGYCSSLECIIIPSSVKKIKSFAFNGCDKLIKVVCFAKNPPVLDSYSFEALSSKILYVPNKSLSEYKSTNIWNGFGIIQSADEEINPGTLSSCSTPNLTFFSGNLSFESSTPGAEYHYTIKDSDVATDKYNTDGKVQLNGKLDISVYATADGYKASDKATATLYWLNAEGGDDTNNINLVKTRGVMVTTDSDITISGLNDGEVITFFSVNGVNLGSAKAVQGVLHFAKPNESIVIDKIKGNDLKIAIK